MYVIYVNCGFAFVNIWYEKLYLVFEKVKHIYIYNMSVFLDICILILLAVPFIIHCITLIIFCHEYLNVINDVLVYYKENKKSPY